MYRQRNVNWSKRDRSQIDDCRVHCLPFSSYEGLSLLRAIYVALARRLAASHCRSLNGVFVGFDFSAPLQHFSGSSVKIRHRARWDVITELRTMRDGWG